MGKNKAKWNGPPRYTTFLPKIRTTVRSSSKRQFLVSMREESDFNADTGTWQKSGSAPEDGPKRPGYFSLNLSRIALDRDIQSLPASEGSCHPRSEPRRESSILVRPK